MERGSGGVTVEQLAARLAVAEDALAAALARLDAVDRDHAASRDERRAQHTALAHIGDLMLALGQRVGKVERAVDAQDELARLRHAEVMAALGVAARDTTAKGQRLDTNESSLARAWRSWGWQTTILAIVSILANVAAANLWRLDRHERTSTTRGVGSGSPATHLGPEPVGSGRGRGADLPGATHAQP